MAKEKSSPPPAIDDFDAVPREEWVFANVPVETIMGDPFPTVRINVHEFKAGFKEVVPPSYAEHITIIVNGHQKEAMRRLQPKKDIRSLLQQAGTGNRSAEAVNESGKSLISGRQIA